MNKKTLSNTGGEIVYFLLLQIFIAAFSISKGDAFRLIYGYDSFGNTCDENNAGNAIPNISLSGLNMKGRPWVFTFKITFHVSLKKFYYNTWYICILYWVDFFSISFSFFEVYKIIYLLPYQHLNLFRALGYFTSAF